MNRKFITTTFARRCSVCKKPVMKFIRNADNTITCEPCMRAQEVIPQQKPGTKRAAMPA